MHKRRDTLFILISLLGSLFIYGFSRLYNLLSLPIFTDEAIYVRWGQIATSDASWRFISLTDGKGPLFIWLMMPLMKLIEDPLLAARLVSVASGAGTLVGLYFLGSEIFKNKKIGVIASFLYSIYPFGLVYDKMALYDSLVGTLIVWGLYVTVILVRRIKPEIAFVLALVAGAGALNKTSGFSIIYFLPMSLLLFDFTLKDKWVRLKKWAFYAAIATILTYIYYGVLRLSPYYHIIDEKNTTFIYPLSEWIQHPFLSIVPNFKGLFEWSFIYLTLPWIVLSVYSFFIKRELLREKIFLFAWFLLPLTATGILGKLLYPRYILFMTLPLLVLVAYSLYQLYFKIKNRYLFAGVFVLCLFLPLRSSYLVLTDFAKAPLPKPDIEQYIDGWPSGGGVREAVNFFKKEAQTKKIFVGTQGTFGLMPYSLELYLVNNPNIILRGFWPIDNTPQKDFFEAAKTMPTYVVFYQPCGSCQNVDEAPLGWPVKKVFQIERGSGKSHFTLYQFIPNSQ